MRSISRNSDGENDERLGKDNTNENYRANDDRNSIQISRVLSTLLEFNFIIKTYNFFERRRTLNANIFTQ